MLNWESIGAGAASGFLSGVMVLLGWNRRIQRLEEDKADKSMVNGLSRNLDDLKDDFKYIRARLDEIHDLFYRVK